MPCILRLSEISRRNLVVRRDCHFGKTEAAKDRTEGRDTTLTCSEGEDGTAYLLQQFWAIRVGIFLSPLLNGSHRLKSRSYQIRNLKNLLTGSSPDHYLLLFLKAIANR